MVGRCAPSKGFKFGIDVLENLHKDGLPVTLEIIGDGPSLGTLKSIVSHKNLLDFVNFAGLKTRKEIFIAMRKASVLLIPSQSQEGFSLVALEAALCELPVVATSIGGLPETISDGRTGFIVEPKDTPRMTQKVKQLLTNQNLAQLMGTAAKTRATSEYNYANYLEKLNSIYLSI
jgi:glycosyltransferase involved in cell wall biosynthesis